MLVQALLLAAVASSSTGEGSDVPTDERATELREELGSALTASDDDLADRIKALGADVLPVAVDALIRQQVQVAGAAQALDADVHDALLGTLTVFGDDKLDEVLAEVVAREDFRSRETVLHVLAEHGNSQDLDLLFASVTPIGEQGRSSDLERTYRDSLKAILQRDPGTFAELQGQWSDIDSDTRSDTIRAIGKAGERAGLDLLTDVLPWESENRVTVLTEITRLAPSARVRPPSRLVDQLRSEASVANEETSPSAALALGKLRESTAVPDLIELMRGDHRGTTSNAYWALKEITGLSMPQAPERWQTWYENELDWYDEECKSLFNALQSAEANVVIEAVRSLSTHTLFRDEIAWRIADALSHPEPSVRAYAAVALDQIDSLQVVPTLVATLADDQEQVRVAAWTTLQRLTREDLPVGASEWEQVAARYTF